MAEPVNQPIPVSVAPVQEKKYAKKLDRPVRDDNEPRPPQKQEKEAEPETISRSLSLREMSCKMCGKISAVSQGSTLSLGFCGAGIRGLGSQAAGIPGQGRDL